MKKMTECLKKAGRKATARISDRERRGWPPGCSSFTYQPMRPSDCERFADKPDTVENT